MTPEIHPITPDFCRAKMRELFTVEEKQNIDKLIAMGEYDQVAAVVSIENPEQERILQRYINLTRPKPETEESPVRAEMSAAEQRGEVIDSPEAEKYWQERLDAEEAEKKAKNTDLENASESVLTEEDSSEDKRTKKEIIAALEAAGIEHDPALKKADLLTILNATNPIPAAPAPTEPSPDVTPE